MAAPRLLASTCRHVPGLASCRGLCRTRLHLHASHAQPSSFSASSTSLDSASRGVTFYAPTEHGLQLVAARLAQELRPGDCYLLYGDVGAGKSVWSRAFIRAAAQDPDLPVPSPTYLLQNTYDDHGTPEIHHFDLYRLPGGSERDLARVNLRASLASAVCLIEWAERLEHRSQRPDEHLAVHIHVVSDEELRRLQPLRASPSASPAEPGRDSASPDGHPQASPVGARPDAGGTEGEDGEEGGADDEDEYSDRRCRRVTLTPHGAGWQRRLQALSQELCALAPNQTAGGELYLF